MRSPNPAANGLATWSTSSSLEKGEDLDLSQVRATCARLFEYRRQQTWPPTIVAGAGWGTLYAAAVEDIDVRPDVEAAVSRVNDFVQRIS